MAKAMADIRSLARAHTETAIRVLAGIMREDEAPAAARVAAAQALLDRGWGKPVQALVGADGGPLQITVMRFGEGDGLALQLGGPKIIEAVPGEPLPSSKEPSAREED